MVQNAGNNGPANGVLQFLNDWIPRLIPQMANGAQADPSPAIEMLKALMTATPLSGGGPLRGLGGAAAEGGGNALMNNARTLLPASRSVPGRIMEAGNTLSPEEMAQASRMTANPGGGFTAEFPQGSSVPYPGAAAQGAGNSLGAIIQKLLSNPAALGTGAGLGGAAMTQGPEMGAPGDAVQGSKPADPTTLKLQIQSLIQAGVPASQIWSRVNGDQPLQAAQMLPWGQMIASMGGIDDLSKNAGAAQPTAAGGPIGPGPGAPGQAQDFAAMPPDQQDQAALEHGHATAVPGGQNDNAGSVQNVLDPTAGGAPGGAPGVPPVPGAAPAGGLTVGAAASSPVGTPGSNLPDDTLSSYKYDLMNPERASQNAIGAQGNLPQSGPGFDWLKAYLQPAFLAALARGNTDPAGLAGSLSARLMGQDQDTAGGTVGALKGMEAQGREAQQGAPGADLRQLMDQAHAGSTTARDQLLSKYQGMGYMSFLGTQDPGATGGALAQAIAGDKGHPMAPGMTGVLGNFLSSILTKQVNAGGDFGPNQNNRFGYLSGLLGY